LKAAQANGRRWIGIDKSDHAIKATQAKLATAQGDLFVDCDYDFVRLDDKYAVHINAATVIETPGGGLDKAQ